MSKDHATPQLTLPRQLRFRISNGNYVAQVSQNLGEFVLGTEILELLRLVDQGTFKSERQHRELLKALQQAVQLCPQTGELKLLLEDLIGSGVVLRHDPRKQSGLPAPSSGASDRFADGWIQWAMLADETRVTRYKQAIDSVIRKNHVALDVGAGTGILSYLILRAGAAKVIAIEESQASQTMRKAMRRLTPSMGKSVGLEDRLHIIHGNASDKIAELLKSTPQGIHVMVSELFGHDPLSEGMLPTLREIQTHLKRKSVSEFICIPRNVTVKCCFANLIDPAADRTNTQTRKQPFSEAGSNPLHERIKNWNISRGICADKKGSKTKTGNADSDIQVFRQAFCQTESFETLSFAATLRAGDFELKGQPVTVHHLNLAPVAARGETEKIISSRIKVPGTDATTVILMWFESELAPGVTLSTLPGSPDHCQHWNPILLPLTEAVQPDKFAQIDCVVENDETHLGITFKQDKKIFAAR